MTSADAGAGVIPALSATDLIAAIPGLAVTGITVTSRDVRQLPGASLRFGDVVALYREIRERFDAGEIVGAVVTQGTDSIEETSWLLDLIHVGPYPIVVTGAMRHPAMAGADGPANLLTAIQVAASPLARDIGVMVAFADEVHLAATVRKTHSTSISAFTSPDTGPVGHLTEGRVRIWGRRSVVVPRLPNVLHVDLDAPRVLVLPVTLGIHPELLTNLSGGIDGLVLAGFGVGHVPADLVDSLTELAGRVPVVLTSRTGAGSTATGTYAFPGSESDLIARGLIPSGYLDPYKARILLQVLLATGATADVVSQAFGAMEGPTSGEPLWTEVADARR